MEDDEGGQGDGGAMNDNEMMHRYNIARIDVYQAGLTHPQKGSKPVAFRMGSVRVLFDVVRGG